MRAARIALIVAANHGIRVHQGETIEIDLNVLSIAPYGSRVFYGRVIQRVLLANFHCRVANVRVATVFVSLIVVELRKRSP